jgi:hypothetical protein
MRRIFIYSFLLSILLAVISFAQQPIIIDHFCTDFTTIPEEWITKAKSELRIGHSHTSHGSQLVTGMDAIEGMYSPLFDYDYENWGLHAGIFFNDLWGNAGGAEDLGHNGDTTWSAATRQMLNLANNDRNVVIWAWCDGVSDNTPEGIDAYLNAMNKLESDYPKVRFVYMTGHLDGTTGSGTLNTGNDQIRAYCLANNKVLFDFADIESYDPDGAADYMQMYADDSCKYDSDSDGLFDSNWARNWSAVNPTSHLTQLASYCGECAHSEKLNCELKGGGTWWLFARLAGWEGAPSSIGQDEQARPNDFTLLQNYPNPFNAETVIAWSSLTPSHTVLKVYDVLGNEVATLVDEEKPAGRHEAKFNGSRLASGIYSYVLKSGDRIQTQKMNLLK